jgi:cytochrome c-type biogenesis protein CcmH
MSPARDPSWPRLTVIVLALAATLFAANAVEPDEMLADPALEARARALTLELRCVVCQNQSVDDSDAPLAKDIRVLVRERIMAGDSDDAVRAFIVARYGKYVLLRPPLDGDTVMLWFGPVALLAAALALAYVYMRRVNRAAAAAPPLSAAEEEAVKRLIQEQR